MIEIKYDHSTSKNGFSMAMDNYASLSFIKTYSELRPTNPFKSMNKDHVITINRVTYINL